MVSKSVIFNARILIVDDQKTHLLILEKMLGNAGYQSVECTTDPCQVCELHRTRRYDLILLDLIMPVMDGFQVMERLKKIETRGYMSVLAITAEPGHKLLALQAGAKDCVSKPFDQAEVQTRIHNLLEVRLLYKEVEHRNRLLEQTVLERTTRLQESEARLRNYTELSSDEYWEMDEHLRFTHISGGRVVKEWAIQQQAIGKTRWELPIEADEAAWVAHRTAMQAGRMFTDFEYKFVLQDGSAHWRSVNGEPLFDIDGMFRGYRGIGKDITQRKQTEEALQRSQALLRQLAAHQESIKEYERKRIAREIHDELGQNLLALRLDVSMLHARTGRTHPRLHKKVASALNQIDTTMKAVRGIINDLRPTVLDLGLHAAIEWQVKEFARRSGIACELAWDDTDIELDDSRATALFRILQESLTNVLRHAHASRVRIVLQRESDRLSMMIADNGVGVLPDCQRKENAFGLLGIEERINVLGGTFAIANNADRGATLTISIPLEAGAPGPVDDISLRSALRNMSSQSGHPQ